MMGSGAFAALMGCLAFIRRQQYVQQPALGLTLGSIPGVLIAALVVKSLPLDILRWLVVIFSLLIALLLLFAV